MPGRYLVVAILVGAAALATLAGAHADDDDHERALRLVEEGRIRPLSAVFAAFAGKIDGDIVEVELESEHERYAYELIVLTPDGRYREMHIDASTLELISERSR